VVDRQSCDPSDWLLVLAMRENAQLSVLTGIAAHVRSSLYVCRSIPETASLFAC
jgi:hypothetical protein